MSNSKTKKKIRLSSLIPILVLLIGLSLLLYPSLSNYWNSFHQSRAIMSYMASVSAIDPAEYEAIINEAHAYNDAISEDEFRWYLTDEGQERYNAALNFDGSGNMGFITIEKIHLRLPMYHGVSEAVLQTSIGHIEWSSLPVGGEGTHCVLSGHRGLPSAKLFSELDRLSEGDVFTMSVLNETLTYEVDQIRVVDPTELDDLQIVPGKDYCTLVTCTPYGINTHRLLVRGHRIANLQGEAKVTPDAVQIDTVYVVPFVEVPILLVLLLLSLISTSGRRRRDSYREIMEWEYELAAGKTDAPVKDAPPAGEEPPAFVKPEIYPEDPSDDFGPSDPPNPQ